MAYGDTKSDISGLNRAVKVQDLEESRKIYNLLPDDSHQPDIIETHIHNLAALFARNNAEGILGIHLAHGHFVMPEDSTLLGITYDTPYCRWAKTTPNQAIDLSNVHGHIFVLTDHGFHPYEYQAGPLPDLSGVSNAFFPELTDYLETSQLSGLVGLQIIDKTPAYMLELILPLATVMLDVKDLDGCVPTRQTGWKFEVENGEPRTCTSMESHATHANGHDIFNKGAPYPKLETFKDVKNALVQVGILCR